ncbi:putative porin [Oceanicoccus sp. KOV_DT_Chl]|uniref:putative porin n=1 Tax=Oceanicoccus sp. KOV_DT_Chl TaxID=1904639 RepID=UPI000C7E1274|nr:putative porin [Oceanicoccus sp. KOV_DT_Chl]
MKIYRSLAAAVIFFTGHHCALQAQELTTTDLLNLLVAEKVISEEKAVELIEKIQQRQQRAVTPPVSDEQAVAASNNSSANVVRVPYVPAYVKEEIRRDVEQGVRTQVTEDVVAHAKTERWGIPNALPAWVNKISIQGDARLRYEGTFFDEENPALVYYDLAESNGADGRISAGRDAFINTTEDRNRLRGRFRLKVKAKVTEGIEAGLRLATGNTKNPVSTNKSLGNYGENWESNFDQAYLRYTSMEKSVMLVGGRFENPFLSTQLVWDSDLNFDGVAGRWNILRNNDLGSEDQQWDPFITIGAFPLGEINQALFAGEDKQANDDKWLYAAQIGTHFDWYNQSRLSVGLAYYYYDNISGIRNDLNSDLYDVTAPESFQFGNWVYDIKNDNDPDSEYFALASEYELLNATIEYDYAGFAPHHLWVTADLVKNLAFDTDELNRIAPPSNVSLSVPERDIGYQFGIAVGWPSLNLRGNWRVALDYRHLEGDAVVDAFADSDFLLGGTNAKGYILRWDYALKDNTWFTMRLLSADEIDAATQDNVAVDTVQMDINARF